MKVLVTTSEDENGCACESLFIDDKKRESIFPLCESPEDAIIGRSLISCSQIASYMKLAHEAGRKGEELTVEVREASDDED